MKCADSGANRELCHAVTDVRGAQLHSCTVFAVATIRRGFSSTRATLRETLEVGALGALVTNSSAMSEVLTEGRVSKNILSFGEKDFLFTGTVCKAWKENSVDTETGDGATIQSLSRVKEALIYALPEKFVFKSLDRGADMAIIEELDDDGCEWEQNDLEFAAQNGRKDVLQFLHEKGVHLDERVLHTAVRHDHLQVVKYLLSIDTPVDKTVIEWGFGPCIIDELKMRSLEVAIKNKNVEMVKTLRTVDYPFDESTFRTACKTKNVEMMKYLHEQGCEPDEDLFYDCNKGFGFDVVETLCRMGLFRDEWGEHLSSYIQFGRESLMTFLLGEGIIPDDDCVDSAVSSGILETAVLLTSNYACRPTPMAYLHWLERVVYSDTSNFRILRGLHWLYGIGCTIGFSSFEEMKNDSRGSKVLDLGGSAVSEWFKERLG